MISDLAAFLRYFEGVHRRTTRDVGSLTDEAETWRPPPSPDEETSWGIPEIVKHISEARMFFAGAFLDRGWVWEPWPQPLERRAEWVPALDDAFDRFSAEIADAPVERLTAKVDPIAKEGRPMSGWRVLLMMVEHEVHHRSQIETYAGLNGWPVNQIFGRTSEWVAEQREAEMRDRSKR